jgi:hypothetical protein
MSRLLTFLFALVVAASFVLAEREKSRDEKKQEEIRKASRKLASFDRNGPDESFIRDRAEQAAAGSYLFERLIDAVDDLLDAGEELNDAARPTNESRKQPEPAETARYLERTYFRVMQADYYSRISADPRGPDYVGMARRLYQAGRREYDSRNYARARRFAGAAGEIVNTLENLAQAAVRVPEPPKLEE